MSVSTRGIHDRSIVECPIAVIDFETTGFTPGIDRVVEASVVRLDPGQPPRLAFDTLVNPRRRMAATEIHGITDEDVSDAPYFEDIAGEFIRSISNCVLSAYNVYFDMRFLEYELGLTGAVPSSPHFCLMYMRPMLGLGGRCRLEEACQSHGIEHETAHVSGQDAQASGRLLVRYLQIMKERRISTFRELAALKSYKFTQSFDLPPLLDSDQYQLRACGRLKSRCGTAAQTATLPTDPTRKALGAYWEALKNVLSDLRINDDDLVYITDLRNQLQLKEEQVRGLHARAFASAILQFIDDRWLDDREARKLERLHSCLRQLGWAPGL